VIKRLKANRPEASPETASVNSSVSEATSTASSIPVPHLEPPAQKLPPTADTPAEERDDLVSFVDLLFGGRLASMIVCGTCKSVSHTYEDFMDLSMSMPGEAPKEKKVSKGVAIALRVVR
jgi:ubiquitin carboxyl-terminal hydrolase 16/45